MRLQKQKNNQMWLCCHVILKENLTIFLTIVTVHLNCKNNMKGDAWDGTFLFKIDVFQKPRVFNILIRGAHYAALLGRRAPRSLPHIFVYFSLFGEIFIFRQMCAIFVSRAAGSVSMLNLCGKHVLLQSIHSVYLYYLARDLLNEQI